MALYPRIPLSTLINYDPTILDGFYYPASALPDFLSYFQLEYGEMMPIYQETKLLKEHIRVVAQALKPTIDAWEEALQIQYSPLENYDRMESGTDKTDHGKGETITGGHTDTVPSNWVEHQVSADNTHTYYQAEKTITDEDKTIRTYQNEKTQESGNTIITHNWRTHGNVGVTTSQQMLREELDVRKFCFMEEVGRLYAEKLLIMLY